MSCEWRQIGFRTLVVGVVTAVLSLMGADASAQRQGTTQENDALQRGETTTREVRPVTPVTDDMLRNPDPGDWLMMNRTYDYQGYSPLDQIDRANVGRLQLAWMRPMNDGAQELRPLVHDGVMYIAHPGSDHIQALDATTGDLIWDFRLPPP